MKRFIALIAIFLIGCPAFADSYAFQGGSGGGGGSSVQPATNNFRLTLTTGVPVTTTDVTAASTFYFTPYSGNHISTYDASTWTDHSSAEVSLAVPASLHRIYDVFAYYTGGALTLTTTAWDSAGQTTGTVTAATAASPCVITATNTLTNGDLVFVDGIVGSLGTDSSRGLNGKCVVVASASGSGFTAAGMDTTGLTYTSGGTFYRVPTARTTAIVRQDGVYCQSGALDHRYVGTIVTVASGQTEDSTSRRLVYNYTNRVPRKQFARDPATTWAYASATIRPANRGTTAGIQRNELVAGVVEDLISANYAVSSQPNATYNVGVGLNSCTVNSADNGYQNPLYGSGTSDFTGYPQLGYNFVQNLESSPSAGSVTVPGFGNVTTTIPSSTFVVKSNQ